MGFHVGKKKKKIDLLTVTIQILLLHISSRLRDLKNLHIYHSVPSEFSCECNLYMTERPDIRPYPTAFETTFSFQMSSHVYWDTDLGILGIEAH